MYVISFFVNEKKQRKFLHINRPTSFWKILRVYSDCTNKKYNNRAFQKLIKNPLIRELFKFVYEIGWFDEILQIDENDETLRRIFKGKIEMII